MSDPAASPRPRAVADAADDASAGVSAGASARSGPAAPSGSVGSPAVTPEAALLRDEYIDASNNARQFNTLRFAELTIFMTATGALVTLVFSRVAAPTSLEASIALKVLGLVVSVVFWVLHERTMIYWRHFIRRAMEIEAMLGFSQYSSRPKEGPLPGSRVVQVLFLAMIVFWVVAMGWIPSGI